MEYSIIEQKRNQLNLDIRKLLTIIDMIDGISKEYDDYVENTLNEEEFLDQQIKLIQEANNRMMQIFK